MRLFHKDSRIDFLQRGKASEAANDPLKVAQMPLIHSQVMAP